MAINTYENLLSVYNSIKTKIPIRPKIALILGSGLGDFAEGIEIVSAINYDEIDNFPHATVLGHKGRFVFGYLDTVPVVAMQGRIHYYEGYPIEDVVLPTRLMYLMGAGILFLTNAAGGIGSSLKHGDFMLIRDHISFFVPSPLIGKNADELGLRFPDMTEVYDKNLCKIIEDTAKNENIKLASGIYCQLTGPNFETPAEIQFLKHLGIDAVGMSTAVEAMAAKHCGMKVCGISMISNLAAGISPAPLSHEEVYETAVSTAPLFKKLVHTCIVAIANAT